MRNIRAIIRGDFRRITASVVGIVFIMGLCLVPCLYAWFNIFSNWDPYGKDATSRIRVAVVSTDKGTDVLGVRLNLGSTIVQALESNDQIGWVFADSRNEALWRVYSGDCYAAILVPEDFSRDFVSFLTLRFEHPELQYYENGKKNAIAPKITGQAKNAVQKQINATVLSTLLSTASEALLALEANGMDVEQLLLDLGDKLDELSVKLGDANSALDNVIGVANAAQSLLISSSTLVGDISATIGYTGQLADILAGDTASMDSSVREVVSQINQALAGVSGNFNSFSAQLGEALGSPEAFNAFLNDGRDQAVASLTEMQARAAELQSLANGAGLSALGGLFGQLSGGLGEMSAALGALEPIDVSDNERWQEVRTQLNEILTRSAGVSQTLSAIIQEVAKTVGIRIEDVFGRLNGAAQNTAELLELLRGQTASASSSLAGAAGRVAALEGNILSAESGINEIRAKLAEISDFVDALAQSDFLNEVLELLRKGPDVLDTYVASPIRVSEEILYPVDSYGSQMAPFYTVLSQWVAALFCAVLLKTRIREEDRPRGMTMPQHFFGRYALFFTVCVAQALITSIGDLLYVDIVCVHPVSFVLAAVMTGVCFSMINYMLSFTLGAAGLAISVIVMVLQVGGAGGTYPVEVLPRIFQVLYPFMPYKFALNAMREALSGFYGNYYWWNMGVMALITLGCILAAFAIYIPGKWLNGLLENAKAKNGIMI